MKINWIMDKYGFDAIAVVKTPEENPDKIYYVSLDLSKGTVEMVSYTRKGEQIKELMIKVSNFDEADRIVTQFFRGC